MWTFEQSNLKVTRKVNGMLRGKHCGKCWRGKQKQEMFAQKKVVENVAEFVCVKWKVETEMMVEIVCGYVA